VTTGQQALGRATVAQRWLARLALVAAAAAVLVAPVVAGLRQSLALVLVGLVGLALTMAGVWWALTNKGLVRGLAVALAVAAPLTVLVLYTRARLTWVVLVALGLLALAVAAGRAALRRDAIPERMQEYDVAPPRRPFLIMNPRSGGGKVTRFGLKDKAEALGATVALLEGPQVVDVGELAREQGPRLLARAGNATVEGPQAVLVSNNVYGMGDIAGLGRRARLDRGNLGVFAVTVASAVQAAGLVRGTQSRGVTRLAGREVVVDADAAQIPVGVDGEALLLDTPVRCTIRPAALRVRVPRHRPGVPDPKPIMDWKRLRQMALTMRGTGQATPDHG